MDASTIIYYLISLLLVVDGVYALIKGTQLFSSAKEKENRNKYPTTYAPAHRFFGACLLIAGLCFIINQLAKQFSWFDTQILLLIGLGVVIVGVVVYFIILKKRPKGAPKDKGKGKGISGYGD